MSLISFLLSIVILFELTFVVGAHLEWFVYDYFNFPRLGFAQIMGLIQLIHLLKLNTGSDADMIILMKASDEEKNDAAKLRVVCLLIFVFLVLPFAYGTGYLIHLAT